MNAHVKIPSDIIGLTTPASVSRRSFFMTASAAAAAGYSLAAGPVRAQVVTTDTKGLKTGDATVKVNGGDMPVYWARPEKGSNHPVVLVAMEIFGLHEYIKDVTRRLAKAGAFAIAPNYYFRAGEDLTKITEMPKLMPIVNGKPDAELLADLDAVVKWAKTQKGNTTKLGIVGSVVAAGRFGSTPLITRALRPALRSTARWSTRPLRRKAANGRRARPSSHLR
jgi:carboxymethylenebutenolidase